MSNIPTKGDILFRQPTVEDGAAVHDLIAACKPLDENSLYCNLLQCSHFADSAVLAERDGEVVGFVSAYHLPEQPKTLFVWQIAVSKSARGQGLASRILDEAIARGKQRGATHLHTTITPDNEASWATFRKLADRLNTELNHKPFFERDKHFAGRHDTEELLIIGPF
ncbi:diaminobutyrate acetyltransferase [Suttonella sp. R2A3]|uniref:diaminobutyrate acetyltransferase n=1 Tax=Suttonella sp. R2A3 TaxID=2908648 RepID=UPI001F21DD2E|nr:diaminobutyrate acetyltransferase [Suttonella sp. R2A3]UJF24500.1 diaminobutyrate acetyltransferase [Suttonella sp. R2A3]